MTPPDQSELRATPQLLAFWDERARQLGRPGNWRLTDQQREDTRRAVLGGLPPGRELWVYSYGSLMWDPALYFTEVRLAGLQGYQRRFTFRTILGRGCPERPALMLSLEPQAGCCCAGLVFRIAPGLVDQETTILWRREMVRGSYCPRLLPVDTPQGTVSALVFTANRDHPDHVGELPMDQTAEIIAGASGVIGSNRDYLEQLAAQLGRLSIDDAYIVQLLHAVRARSDRRRDALA